LPPPWPHGKGTVGRGRLKMQWCLAHWWKPSRSWSTVGANPVMHRCFTPDQLLLALHTNLAEHISPV